MAGDYPKLENQCCRPVHWMYDFVGNTIARSGMGMAAKWAASALFPLSPEDQIRKWKCCGIFARRQMTNRLCVLSGPQFVGTTSWSCRNDL